MGSRGTGKPQRASIVRLENRPENPGRSCRAGGGSDMERIRTPTDDTGRSDLKARYSGASEAGNAVEEGDN